MPQRSMHVNIDACQRLKCFCPILLSLVRRRLTVG